MQKTSMTSVMAIVFLLLQLIQVAQSITCYNCTSVDNANCGSNFVASGLPTCKGATCTKAFTNAAGQDIVVRQCSDTSTSTSYCGDVYIQGFNMRACFCSTDYCNPGNRLVQNNYFLLIAAFIAVYYVFANFAK